MAAASMTPALWAEPSWAEPWRAELQMEYWRSMAQPWVAAWEAAVPPQAVVGFALRRGRQRAVEPVAA